MNTLSWKEVDDMFYLPADHFFPRLIPEAVTYKDVSLKTNKSEIAPSKTDTSTTIGNEITLSNPIISSDMDTVTEEDMAIAMALNWWLWLIHSNLPPEKQVKMVAKVKFHVNGIIRNPITVHPAMEIGEILNLKEEKGYRFSTFPVIDEEWKLLWLLSSEMVKDRFKTKKVYEVMKIRENVLTIDEAELWKDPIAVANSFFDENIWINKLLVVNKNDILLWLITVSDIDKIMKESTSMLKPTRDSEHRLRVWATLFIFRKEDGSIDGEKVIHHVDALVDKWVDIVAVSTAHGHTKDVWEMVELIRQAYPELSIIAGNVTSAEWVEFLIQKWANTIKIGQWPGSICTTREVAWVWIPQMTALYVCSKISRHLGWTILADGGITSSWDMVKALTLADGVMCGSLLAGCPESPWEIIEIDGKLYKSYRWMGSKEAMDAWSAARYGHIKKWLKWTPEGISAMKELTWPANEVLRILHWGIQSGLGYLWAENLSQLRFNARYVRMSWAWQTESKPHSVVEVKKVGKN